MSKKSWIKLIILKLIIIGLVAGMVYLMMNAERKVVIIKGNESKLPIAIIDNKFQDAHCGMVLVSSQYAAEVISISGNTWFFHDPGGIPLWLQDKHKDFRASVDIWFFTEDTNMWKKSDEVWFSLADTTPMNYGFAAYEKKKPRYISYQEMKLRMLRGENMTDPRIKKMLESDSGDR